MRPLVLAFVFALTALPACAQTPVPAPQPRPQASDIASHPDWLKATANDVDSVDHLIAALYDVISGPATKQRDWNRFRSLFLPSGRLGPIRPSLPAKDGKPAQEGDVTFLTPEAYSERAGPSFSRAGFFEHGIAMRVEQFGNLVHVWTTYESRHAADDPKPFARGINSVQIVHAGDRYWIASIMWDAEREGLTLPEKYLSSPQK